MTNYAYEVFLRRCFALLETPADLNSVLQHPHTLNSMRSVSVTKTLVSPID